MLRDWGAGGSGGEDLNLVILKIHQYIYDFINVETPSNGAYCHPPMCSHPISTLFVSICNSFTMNPTNTRKTSLLTLVMQHVDMYQQCIHSSAHQFSLAFDPSLNNMFFLFLSFWGGEGKGRRVLGKVGKERRRQDFQFCKMRNALPLCRNIFLFIGRERVQVRHSDTKNKERRPSQHFLNTQKRTEDSLEETWTVRTIMKVMCENVLCNFFKPSSTKFIRFVALHKILSHVCCVYGNALVCAYVICLICFFALSWGYHHPPKVTHAQDFSIILSPHALLPYVLNLLSNHTVFISSLSLPYILISPFTNRSLPYLTAALNLTLESHGILAA